MGGGSPPSFSSGDPCCPKFPVSPARLLAGGSNAGIGAGIAKRLAQAGAAVVLHGLGDPAEIAAFRAELASEHGVTVTYAPGDLATPDGVAEMMKAVRVYPCRGKGGLMATFGDAVGG